MFRENNGHLQEELFTSYTSIDERIQKRLQNSWAPLFYEHVFCKIEEKQFACLYNKEVGRPNFPVNILFSLEIIKHLKELTDEELIEQFYFNYQIHYAIGIRNLGELYLAPRTLYDFRSRLNRHIMMHPKEESLIQEQFSTITDHFIKEAKLDTREQRSDSSQIIPNIRQSGRLALAYEVLVQAVKACPEELLTPELKETLKDDYKVELLHRTKNREAAERIQTLIDLCGQLLKITDNHPQLKENETLKTVERFLEEQAIYNPNEDKYKIKENKVGLKVIGYNFNQLRRIIADNIKLKPSIAVP